MKIKELLNKYFEGETTCEEERALRLFFAKEEIPEDMEVYRSLFAYIDEEKRVLKDGNIQPVTKPVNFRKRMYYIWSGVAAGLLIMVGIAGMNTYFNRRGDYVVIDGRRYADISLAREQAKEAFLEVSFSREDVFDSLFSD